MTRINSILRRAGLDESAPYDAGQVYTDSERDLMLAILLSGEAFAKAFDEKAPNYICESAYDLATAFSRFYHDNHILSETDGAKRAAWLGLCALTKRLLVKHLDVLGIEPVESM